MREIKKYLLLEISDELRDSMNRKIDQLKIDIATMQSN